MTPADLARIRELTSAHMWGPDGTPFAWRWVNRLLASKIAAYTERVGYRLPAAKDVFTEAEFGDACRLLPLAVKETER